MLGPIYTALSGMNAYSKGLQEISNNVSNLNTSGFKAETVNFSSIYDPAGGGLAYTGSDANAGGQGVQIDTPLTDFSQGTLQQTGNPLDLAIQGSGFLVLQNAGQTYYVRTGSFGIDENQNVVLQGTPKGSSYQLMVLNSANQAVPANVSAEQTSAPAATTTITLGQNLSSASTSANVSGVSVFDSLGDKHTWTIALAPTTGAAGASATGPQSWTVTVTDENGAKIGTGVISFNNGAAVPGSDMLTVTEPSTDGSAPLSVVLDFSSVSSFNSGATSTLQASNVDGNASGSLTSATVNSAGDLQLTYTNGLTKSLGAVAIATFSNPEQLKQLSGGLYENTSNVRTTLLASGQAGSGSVVAGEIESSNVNLTQEFGDLILIQRGYQASSEVVSVSNDMIQQLFGIRGQGG